MNVTYFQPLIRILRWIVELVRAYITMETSVLAYMIIYSCEGHIKEVFHMFDFLKANDNIFMVFDSTDPDIDLSKFPREN